MLSIVPKGPSVINPLSILSSNGNPVGKIDGIATPFPKTIIRGDHGNEVWRFSTQSALLTTLLRLLRKSKSSNATLVSREKKIIFKYVEDDSWKWKANHGKTFGDIYSKITGDVLPAGTDVTFISIGVYVLEQSMLYLD